MPKKKYKTLIHINVTEDQHHHLNDMGGPTEGFRKLYAFWYQNYEIWEEQEQRRLSIKKRMEGMK